MIARISKPITQCNTRQAVAVECSRNIVAASENTSLESISMRRYKISTREISATVGLVNHSVGVSIVVSARSVGRVRDSSTRHAGRWCSSNRRSRRLRCRACHANCAQTWINRGIESLPAAVDSTETIGDAND